MDKLVIDQSRTYRQLLRNELEILRESNHKKIMKVYELLEDEKFYYVISELIEGGSVMNRMRKLGKPFSDSQALIIVKQIMQALLFLHSKCL